LRDPIDNLIQTIRCFHKELDWIDRRKILHVFDLELAEAKLHEGIDAEDHVERQFLLKCLARFADTAKTNPWEFGYQHAQEKIGKKTDDECYPDQGVRAQISENVAVPDRCGDKYCQQNVQKRMEERDGGQVKIRNSSDEILNRPNVAAEKCVGNHAIRRSARRPEIRDEAFDRMSGMGRGA